MNKFEFEMGEKVKLIDSGESGTVTARAEFQYGENQYFVRYKSGAGVACQIWWPASALEAA
jgi:hypothetical protein